MNLHSDGIKKNCIHFLTRVIADYYLCDGQHVTVDGRSAHCIKGFASQTSVMDWQISSVRVLFDRLVLWVGNHACFFFLG